MRQPAGMQSDNDLEIVIDGSGINEHTKLVAQLVVIVMAYEWRIRRSVLSGV